MIDTTIPRLLVSSQATVVGADRSLQRRCERGELIRLRAGVYVEVSRWRALKPSEQFRTRVHAAATRLPEGTQFSHQSALALWHLPIVGGWPARVEALAERTGRGTSSETLQRYSFGLDSHPEIVNRATVTSLLRTTLDIARTTSFLRAVCAVDAALHPAEPGTFRFENQVAPLVKTDVIAALTESDLVFGTIRAERAIAFSDGSSDSPGESVSRVQFHLMGYPPPELQVPFFDEQGFIGYADFYWPELDLIGEFDGDVKYLGATYRRGRLPEEVVLAEKRREDRMRRVARGFVRWDWAVANNQAKLAARVAPHGLLPLR